MATWGVHLRVARCFIDNLIAKKYHREFVIGSVAPDADTGSRTVSVSSHRRLK